MFRVKKGVRAGYVRQGYIYFVSRTYKDMRTKDKERIRELCEAAGDGYGDALLEFVTTDASATAIEMKYGVSKSTLYRAVRRYYDDFPKQF